MRIREFSVDQYGPWKGLRLSGMSDGMNVAYVPDPADRRAFFDFIRFVLSGPSSRTWRTGEDRAVHDRFRGESAGSVVLEGDDGSFRLYRDHVTDSTGKRVSGDMSVTASSGKACQHSPWSQTCQRVDPETLLNVVLPQTDESLSSDDLLSLICTGLLASPSRDWSRMDCQSVIPPSVPSARSLLGKDVTDEADSQNVTSTEMSSARSTLLARQLCQINLAPARLEKLVEKRRNLEDELREESRSREQYARYAAEESRLCNEIHRLEMQIRRLGADHAVPAEQGGDFDDSPPHGHQQSLPVDAINELAPPASVSHGRRSDERREQIRSMRRQLKNQSHQLENSPVYACAERLRALLNEHASIVRNQVALVRVESQLDRLGAEMALSQIDRSAESTDQNVAHELPVETWKILMPHAKSLVAAGQRYRRLRREGKSPVSSVEPQTATQRSVQNVPPAESEDSFREANRRVSQLRQRVELDRHIDQMRQSRQLLDAECRGLARQQSVPVWLYCVLVTVFVAGLLLVVAGIVAFRGQVNWLCIGVGMTLSLASALAKLSFHRLASDRLMANQRQLHVLKMQIANALQQRDLAGLKLSASDDPPEAQLQKAEVYLANLEKATLPGKTQDSSKGRDRQREPNAEARRDYYAARNRWREALTQLGLPSDLAPSVARALIRSATPGDSTESPDRETQQRQLVDLEAQRQELTDAIAMWRAESCQLLAELGRETSDESAGGIAEQLRSAFRERSKIRRQLRELVRQRATLRRQEEQLLGDGSQEEDSRRQPRAKELQNLKGRIGHLRDQQRQCREEQASLASSRRFAKARLEWNEAHEQIRQNAETWQAGMLAMQMMDQSTLMRESRDRADEVLTVASAYLTQLSAGRLVQLVIDPSLSDVRVLDQRGRSVPASALSPLELQMVHLSLRLGKVQRMAAEGIRCPLFADDALLATNDRQADVIEAVLYDFSLHGHQVVIVVADEDVLARLESLQLPSARIPAKKDGPVDVSFRIRTPRDASEHASHSLVIDRMPNRLDEDTGVSGPSHYEVLGPITVPRDTGPRRAETGVNHVTDTREPRSQTDSRASFDSGVFSRQLTSPQPHRFSAPAVVGGEPCPVASLDTHESHNPATENSLDAARHDVHAAHSEDLPDWWPD